MRGVVISFILALSLCITGANSGINHGQNTTFDPNSFGGNWTCITAAVTNVCTNPGGVVANCNGTGEDWSAMEAWRSAMIALNPAVAKLYIPPGSRCIFYAGGGGDVQLLNGTRNAIVWGYGATVDGISFGAQQAFQNPATTAFNALVQSFNPGDSSVTLITGSDASKFTVGNPVAATCISTATDGQPPTFLRFDYRFVASKVGSVIGLSSPLDVTCKSTYPFNTTDIAGQGGPAMLYALDPNWNINAQYFGLSIDPSTTGLQWNWVGRNVTLTNVNLGANSLNPSASDNLTCNYCVLNTIELDKVNNNVSFNYGSATQLQAQTASTNNLVLNNFTLQGVNSLNGTTTSTTIVNSKISSFKLGPLSTGIGGSLSVDATYVDPALLSFAQLEYPTATTGLSYSNGVFAVAKSTQQSVVDFLRVFVPTGVYQFGWHNSFGSGNCTPLTTFIVTDMSEDASNVYATTGNWKSAGSPVSTPASLPTPTCLGSPTSYVAYPALTIKQTNSPMGSADLTQYAAPP